MKNFTRILAAVLILTGFSTMAQDQGKLTVKGHILCEKKAEVISSVTIYRYYHMSQSVELMGQQMVADNRSFKFNLQYDMEYIIDVALNTGIHKRINLNTEVMKGYKYEDQKFEFEVDVQSGDMENPEEVAWIYFDPEKNDFSHTDQMPIALQKK